MEKMLISGFLTQEDVLDHLMNTPESEYELTFDAFKDVLGWMVENGWMYYVDEYLDNDTGCIKLEEDEWIVMHFYNMAIKFLWDRGTTIAEKWKYGRPLVENITKLNSFFTLLDLEYQWAIGEHVDCGKEGKHINVERAIRR